MDFKKQQLYFVEYLMFFNVIAMGHHKSLLSFANILIIIKHRKKYFIGYQDIV